jgi:hypothetical protein
MICITNINPSVHEAATPPTEESDASPPPTDKSLPPVVAVRPNIDAASNTDQSFLDINNSLLLILKQVERHNRSVTDLTDGVANLAQRLLKMEEVCNALPLSRAATEADKLSKHMVEAAAEAMAESMTRAKRILIRGLPYSAYDPVGTAQAVIVPILPIHPYVRVTSASWFFRKNPVATRPLLVTFATAEQRTVVLQAKNLITDSFKALQIHADRPPALRSPQTFPLPSAARVNLTPTNPIFERQISGVSSNYHSPLESPTLTPSKPGHFVVNILSPEATEAKPISSDWSPMNASILDIAPGPTDPSESGTAPSGTSTSTAQPGSTHVSMCRSTPAVQKTI